MKKTWFLFIYRSKFSDLIDLSVELEMKNLRKIPIFTAKETYNISGIRI